MECCETEMFDMLLLAVALSCAMIYGIIVVFFWQGVVVMCFRLIRRAYPGLRNLFRKVYTYLRGFELNTDF
jgi:hypothetical protein